VTNFTQKTFYGIGPRSKYLFDKGMTFHSSIGPFTSKTNFALLKKKKYFYSQKRTLVWKDWVFTYKT